MQNDTAYDLQANRLKKLIAANQALAQVESLSELLPVLLEFARDVTQAIGASILLYKPESNTLEFTLAINEVQGAAEEIISKKFELAVGEGIAGHVAKTRESLLVADTQEDKRFSRKVDNDTGFMTRSIVCSPIVYQDELLGVVQVVNAKSKTNFDSSDLDILESFSHLAAVAMVRSRLLELRIHQERMQAQMDAATRIQETFFPKVPELDAETDIFAITKPAIFVGGDVYDIIRISDDLLFVCVADVSGKGLPAALVGATLWTKLRSLSVKFDKPSEMLHALNKEMYEVLSQRLFVTCVLAYYHLPTGRITLSLAGHPAPLYITADGVRFLDTLEGMPVGVDPDQNYSELELTINPGESIIMFSDGVVEARNKDREFYGEERVVDFLNKQSAPSYGKALLHEIDVWQQDTQANDDLTILEIWRNNKS